jgi:hypothetical protein
MSVTVTGAVIPTSLGKSLGATAQASTPTGVVAVAAGAQTCTAILSNGAGSCVLSFAAAGSYSINASYSGDANYAASNAVVNEVVTAAISSSAALVSAPMLGRWALLLLALALCGLVWRQRVP